MAYIDVVGVSEWLYNYDGTIYYTAEDAEGYFYTVRIGNSTYKKMDDQQEYWMRESDDEPMPDAYRLFGVVRETTRDIKSNLSEVWDISTLEYEEYFGTLYLDADASVDSDQAAGWFVLATMFGLVGLIFLLVVIPNSITAKKCLNRLEERGLLEWAAQQFNAPDNLVVGKDQARFSQQFLYTKSLGVVLAFDDILWCYQQNHRSYFIPVNSLLMVKTYSGKLYSAVNLGKVDRKDEIRNAIVWIAARNPRVLVGFTNENAAACRQMIKQGMR